MSLDALLTFFSPFALFIHNFSSEMCITFHEYIHSAENWFPLATLLLYIFVAEIEKMVCVWRSTWKCSTDALPCDDSKITLTSIYIMNELTVFSLWLHEMEWEINSQFPFYRLKDITFRRAAIIEYRNDICTTQHKGLHI